MNLRKLNSHPTARLSDDLPPPELVAKYIQPATAGHAGTPHWFWVERRPLRGFDADGQATLKWQGRTYNAARVLLQHQLRSRVVRAVNACGLPQCVRPNHWTLEPTFLGAVAGPAALATVRVGDAWRLAAGGVVVARDMAFVARVSSTGNPVLHVVRAIHEEHETVFLTACGELADPAMIVAGGQASCHGCLR